MTKNRYEQPRLLPETHMYYLSANLKIRCPFVLQRLATKLGVRTKVQWDYVVEQWDAFLFFIRYGSIYGPYTMVLPAAHPAKDWRREHRDSQPGEERYDIAWISSKDRLIPLDYSEDVPSSRDSEFDFDVNLEELFMSTIDEEIWRRCGGKL